MRSPRVRLPAPIAAGVAFGLGALGLLGAPRAAGAADADPAEVLFTRGMAQFDAGNFDKACPAIDESYQLDPRPGTLFTLAECEAKRWRFATALRRYDEYLALYASLPRDKKQKQGDREAVARAARAELLPKVSELTITLAPGSPPDTRVTRDGNPVSEAALGVSMRVDPGEHVLTVQAPGGLPGETRVTLANGEKRVVALPVKGPAAQAPALPAPPAEPPPVKAEPVVVYEPEQATSGRRIGAFVAGGAGIVGVLVGAATGGAALGKKSAVDDNCGSGIHASDPAACNAAGLAAASSLKTLGLVSTVGFAVGVAGLGTGIALFATEPKPGATGRVSGRWVSVETLGAGAAVRGAW